MILFALAALVPSSPVSQQKSKVVQAVVLLEDRSISLPQLPLNRVQGRDRFKEVHGQIQNALQDLSLSLQTLCAKPEAGIVLATDLDVPAALAAEGTALVAVLADLEHARLEVAFAEVWKGWQAALVEGGLSVLVRAPAGKPEPHSKQYEEARKIARQTIQELSRQPGKRKDSTLHASYNEENVDLFPDITTGMTEGEFATHQKVESSVYMAQKSWAVTNKLIPSLSETWNPLVDHLNVQARRLADLEQAAVPTADAAMNALRVQTKIAFLERFRMALWYCDLVWCHVASIAAPAPLPRLGVTVAH